MTPDTTGSGVLLRTIYVELEEQLKLSVTVTAYVPAVRFCKSSMIDPLDQANEYVPAGVTERSIEPFGFAQEVLSNALPEIAKLLLLPVTLNVSRTKQPLVPVIVIK